MGYARLVTMPRAMRLVCGALCVLALAVAAPASAILNGTQDTTHTYAGAFYDAQTNQLCSGFLLSPTVAVTAGHCFTNGASIQATFAVDIPDHFEGKNVVGGTVYVDPNYCCGIDNPQTHDVAVVVLKTPVDLSSYAQLPDLGAVDGLDKKATVTAVGYGINVVTRGGGKPQPVLYAQRTSADLQVAHAGASLSDEFLKLASSPGGNQPGLCFGDSGGPLLERGTNTVLALASFGSNEICSGHSYGFRLDTPEAQSFITSFE